LKALGFVLLICGILAIVYGGISYNRERTVVDLGPIKATATEQHNVPFSPIVGGIAIVAGLALLVVPRKKMTSLA
jgi:uncharacterized membrane protein HdeD (DUF308 family)